MPGTLQVDGELDFSVTVSGTELAGSLRAVGSDLEVTVSDSRLLQGTGTRAARVLADTLARQGLTLSVVTDRPLVRLGVSRTSFWQRRVTGSRHIEVASLTAARRLLRLRRRSGGSLVPPPSPLPLLPTFLRRPRRPTTTHDPDRGGYPRLVMAPDPHPGPDTTQHAFLLGDRTVLGSHPSCDIVLEGLQPRHAEIVRTADDELVLRPVVPGTVWVHGAVVLREALLRTGTRVDVGPWTLIYNREEYADHGRPYGGRIGGELGRQRPQPSHQELSHRER